MKVHVRDLHYQLTVRLSRVTTSVCVCVRVFESTLNVVVCVCVCLKATLKAYSKHVCLCATGTAMFIAKTGHGETLLNP